MRKPPPITRIVAATVIPTGRRNASATAAGMKSGRNANMSKAATGTRTVKIRIAQLCHHAYAAHGV